MNEQNIVSEVPARRKRLPTAKERSEWVRRYQESGLSVLQFCDEHQLVAQTLYHWLAKSRSAQDVSVVPSGCQPLPAFREIRLEAPSVACIWAAELQRPGGAVLRVAANAPAALLEQLLRVC